MLKKVGIVAAASVATLVALSPLAFAGENTSGWDDHHSMRAGQENGVDLGDSRGLINAPNTNISVAANGLCNNDVPVAVTGVGAAVPVQKVAVPLQAALGILGDATTGSATSSVTDDRACGQRATNGAIGQDNNN